MHSVFTTLTRSTGVVVGLAVAGLAGCYTVEFDETLGGVYYCQADSDCADNQACEQFRCVDDSGPQVRVTGPEPLQNLAFGTTELTANYSIQDFTISDSNMVVEGQGKVEISVEGTDVSTTSIVDQGAVLDVSALAPGAYRLRVAAVFGDGTPYENPSAVAYTVFYIEDQNPERPQIALMSPSPDYVHKVGEPLDVVVAARNFEFIANGTDCRIDEGCDPWGDNAAECIPTDCDVVPNGHAHVYMLDNYPECLTATPTCNGDYVLSLNPAGAATIDGVTVKATIPADRFTEAGTFTFSAGLQYNDHLPYPTAGLNVYDQLTIEVVE